VDAVPLAHIIHAGFFELVVRRNVRPERPNADDAPQLSEALWKLAERCWAEDPRRRPTASDICNTLSHITEATAVMSGPSSNPAALRPWVHLPPLPSRPPPNLTMRGHTDVVVCTAFSPDGKVVISGSLDGIVMVWDAQTGKSTLPPLKRHSDAVSSLAFFPDGRRIASGSFDKTILIWDLTTGQVVSGPFLGHTNSVWAVCLSPDGKQIASGSGDNTIRLWNTQTGQLLSSPLIGHTNGVYTAAFSGDGKRLVSGSTDNTVRIWDVRSGRPVHGPLRGHRNWVYFVGFSTDGKRIVSASWEGDICVWDTGTGALMSGPSKQHVEHTAAVMFTPISTCCAVSPDGKWVAGYTHSDGQVVRVWDSKTGQLAGTFTEHAQYVHNVSFSPDSRRVLSSSDDKTVQIHTIDW
jgi:WD40 repeat protein